MHAYVGVTDPDWAAFLADRPSIDEVNFWLPNAQVGFGALKPGEPFLFKTHFPQNEIVGGGFFEGYVPLRVSEAWAFFGEGNGVHDATALLQKIVRYRTPRPSTDGGALTPDPTIGCVMLNRVAWFGGQALAAPASFAKNIVRGKRYEPGADSTVDQALSQLIRQTLPGVESNGGSEPGSLGPTRGPLALVEQRLNQGAFRAVVLQAYESRCAITGHRIRPTLQAAHIRPVAAGGEHRLANGLLLRSDIHTLFDLGYITVDPSYRLRVSPRLRADFGNGDALYAQEATANQIFVPRSRTGQPDRQALEWHGDTTFLAS